MTKEVDFLEKTATNAIKKLRKNKLQNGLPFMINSHELPTNQCYLEYPDGSIKLVTINQSDKDFTLLRELSPTERKTIREKYHLL